MPRGNFQNQLYEGYWTRSRYWNTGEENASKLPGQEYLVSYVVYQCSKWKFRSAGILLKSEIWL
jgi:hypothetical protein